MRPERQRLSLADVLEVIAGMEPEELGRVVVAAVAANRRAAVPVLQGLARAAVELPRSYARATAGERLACAQIVSLYLAGFSFDVRPGRVRLGPSCGPNDPTRSSYADDDTQAVAETISRLGVSECELPAVGW